jgi:short-subunit dehydrogenase
MKSFKNKKVWIIGASVGIGAALSEELAKEGAIIALSARDEAKLQELKNNLAGQGHLIFPLDVTDSQKVQQTANLIASNFGNIDSVIFMAATYQTHSNAGFTDINMAKHIIDVNFNGAMNVTHAVLPILNAQGNSQLVYCASVAGYRGLPAGQPYCASKAALINYAESVAIEQKNIDVKIISPGFVKTRLTDKNDFKMPFLINANEAARRIVKGLKSNCFEIHFPKRFTYFMKLVQILPNFIYIPLAKKIKV